MEDIQNFWDSGEGQYNEFVDFCIGEISQLLGQSEDFNPLADTIDTRKWIVSQHNFINRLYSAAIDEYGFTGQETANLVYFSIFEGATRIKC